MELKTKTEHSMLAGRHPNKGCGWTTILIVPQSRVSFHIEKPIIIVFPKNEFVFKF